MKVNLSQENRMPVRTSNEEKLYHTRDPIRRTSVWDLLYFCKESLAIFPYPALLIFLFWNYIKNLLQETIMTDQWSLKEFVVLFMGNGRENGK